MSKSNKMETFDQRELAKSSLTREMAKPENILIESELAVVMKDTYPKAQSHFLVVAKENIDNVTALTREHLPLLDHMMELANQIIEQQKHLPSSDFLVGFKIDAFMKSLTMHVISKDFFSVSLKRKTHWNSFNTDLFLTYQAVYALLRIQGSIEKLPEDKVLEWRKAEQLHCNQCDFESDSLLFLKAHLFEHWKKREHDFEHKKQVDKIIDMLDKSKVDAESEMVVSLIGELPKPTTESTNWRQNSNQTPSNIKNEPTKEQPKSWRQNTNQPATIPEQPSIPYQNSFAKHFQKSIDRQNQRYQIGNPLQGPGLMGPHPLSAPRQILLNGIYPCPPFTPQHRPWIPDNNINQMPQPMDSPARFNPFRQPPNMGQFQPNRYNGPNTVNSNFGPGPQPNQNQNRCYNNRDNSTTMKTQAKGTKPNWKPHPNQAQSKANINNTTSVSFQPNGDKDNSTPLQAQSNQAKENKPKWKPKAQPNQGQNKSFNKPKPATQNVTAKKTQPEQIKDNQN